MFITVGVWISIINIAWVVKFQLPTDFLRVLAISYLTMHQSNESVYKQIKEVITIVTTRDNSNNEYNYNFPGFRRCILSQKFDKEFIGSLY